MAKQTKKTIKKSVRSNIFLNYLKKIIFPAILLVTSLSILIISYEIFLDDKFFPQTFIGDTNVSFLTKARATQLLSSKFDKRRTQKLAIGEQKFQLDLATASLKIDYSIINSTFTQNHNGTYLENISTQIRTLLFKSIKTPSVYINIAVQEEPIAKSVYKTPVDAQIIYNETTTPEGTPSANIQIKESENGSELDKETLEKNIVNFLVFGNFNSELPLKIIIPKITTDHVEKAKDALKASENEPVVLRFHTDSWTIDIKQLLAILDLTSGSPRNKAGQSFLLDKDKTTSFLQNIASQIDQPVTEGQFNFNPDTKKVTAFVPSQEGRKLDIDKTYSLLIQAYNGEINKQITLPVDIVKPKTLTSDINNLGINELIGQGVSRFAGSIENRIYNVALTASKINGVLIPPGEIFSFNKTVGDITAATGFKQAYVIKEGRTVLDDGGGVCQDSTTVFRAALNAGLPIVQRTAHAYRVGYYEQGFPPGLDATVYYPSVDFQFKNDTGKHILIQAYTSGLTLYVNIYGTDDGRVSKLTTPVVTNRTPPPPELRQDDPTLPKGTIKQVDWSAWGANVSFRRTVTRGGETLISETWYSNYKPWQAVFLVGTQ